MAGAATFLKDLNRVVYPKGVRPLNPERISGRVRILVQIQSCENASAYNKFMASAATWRDKRQDVHALPDPKVMTELFQTALSELTASLAQLEGVRAKYQTYVEWETRMNSQRPLSEVYEETKYRLTECNKRLEEAKLSMDWIFSRKKT